MTPVAVYDCMVFLQGAARPTGPAAACLSLAEGGHVTLCLCPSILAEVRDVLARPTVVRKFPSLTPETVAAFLARVGRFARQCAEPPVVLTLARDPKDEKYLNLAAAAGTEYLVSRDNDLLDLTTSDQPEAVALRVAAPRLTILDPINFLNRIRSVHGQSS